MKENTLVEEDLARDVWCVLGLIFDNINMNQTSSTLKSVCDQGRQLTICTPNINFVSMARKDPKFRDSVLSSELSLLDGVPILWMAKLLGIPLTEQVPGSGLIEKLYSQKGGNLRVFLFGGSPGTAKNACVRINEYSAGLRGIGYYDPGYVPIAEMSSEKIINKINSCKPDLLLLALGASKAQKWIDLNKSRLEARVIIHVGATIGFLAGTIKRAPKKIQQIGFEWVWRIFEEPSLWRRYARDGIIAGRLILTRIVPYWIWLRLNKSELAQNSHLDIETHDALSSFEIRLSGIASQQTRPSFRQASIKAVHAKKNLNINLSNLEYIDSSFLATLIVLRKHILSNGNLVHLIGVPSNINRIIRYNCVEFLLSKGAK